MEALRYKRVAEGFPSRRAGEAIEAKQVALGGAVSRLDASLQAIVPLFDYLQGDTFAVRPMPVRAATPYSEPLDDAVWMVAR